MCSQTHFEVSNLLQGNLKDKIFCKDIKASLKDLMTCSYKPQGGEDL